MKVILLGYGKMGQTIEKILEQRNHEIVARFSKDNQLELEQMQTDEADVVIEFTQPEAAVSNLMICFEKGWPVVSGTTGWLAHWNEVVKVCRERKGAFFYASNFSVGVNLFFYLNKQLAKVMQGHPVYQPAMTEIHHIHKKDEPSGTALTLAKSILEHNDKLSGWQLTHAANEPTDADKLPIQSIREGEVFGTHEMGYHSDIDSIEIKHTAHSREGFATGAVLAAEWLQNKSGIFGMNDMLGLG